jgi:sulfoxide reductase heme-binding subunit YedZ
VEVATAPAVRPHRTSARDGIPTRRPRRRITRQTVVHALVVVLALVPAAWAIYGVVSDVFLGTRHFGSNPIKAVEHYTGDWTLRFLALTLAVTPARRITGWNRLARYRRTFGLLAFTYVSLHLLTYAVLDVELSWGDLVADVIKRPYITIGMAGFLLFLPLAVTSTRGWIRRLGRRWTVLHRAVYVIVVLGTIHFWMSVKKDITDPLAFATIFGALLAWRAFTAWNGSRPSALGSRRHVTDRTHLDR